MKNLELICWLYNWVDNIIAALLSRSGCCYLSHSAHSEEMLSQNEFTHVISLLTDVLIDTDSIQSVHSSVSTPQSNWFLRLCAFSHQQQFLLIPKQHRTPANMLSIESLTFICRCRRRSVDCWSRARTWYSSDFVYLFTCFFWHHFSSICLFLRIAELALLLS